MNSSLELKSFVLPCIPVHRISVFLFVFLSHFSCIFLLLLWFFSACIYILLLFALNACSYKYMNLNILIEIFLVIYCIYITFMFAIVHCTPHSSDKWASKIYTKNQVNTNLRTQQFCVHWIRIETIDEIWRRLCGKIDRNKHTERWSSQLLSYSHIRSKTNFVWISLIARATIRYCSRHRQSLTFYQL